MKNTIPGILLLLLASLHVTLSSARAGARAPVTEVLRFTNASSTNKFNMLEGVALNALEATRTVTLTTGRRWPTLKINVFFTHSAASDVTMVMKCSFDGTNYAVVQSGSIAAGVRTLSDLTDTKVTGGANQSFQTSVGAKGCESVQLVFDGTSAGAGDLVDVQVVGVSGT